MSDWQRSLDAFRSGAPLPAGWESAWVQPGWLAVPRWARSNAGVWVDRDLAFATEFVWDEELWDKFVNDWPITDEDLSRFLVGDES